MPQRPSLAAAVQVREAGSVRNHWPDVARRWHVIGLPLRPSAADVALYAEPIAQWVAEQGAPRALILGVTPELYGLSWPPGTDLIAVDHTPAMIEAVWPGPREAAYCAEWTALPLDDGSRDVALCDGGLILLSAFGRHLLVRELHRVLAQKGRCILRLFVPPYPRESADAVLSDLLTGKIANPNVLKLRLGMALQENSTQGVVLGLIWDKLADAAPDLTQLADRLGWPREPLLALDTYRDSPIRYYFLTTEEVARAFCVEPGGFTMQSLRFPHYAMGNCCPTLVLRRDNG